MKAVFDSCGLKANCSSLRIEAAGPQTQVRFWEETGCFQSSSFGCLPNVTSGKLQHVLGEISNSCDMNSSRSSGCHSNVKMSVNILYAFLIFTCKFNRQILRMRPLGIHKHSFSYE